MEKVTEKSVETYLRNRVRAMGGIAYKFVSPGNDGVPDRILVLPEGRVVFTEVKKPTGKLSKIQKIQIKKLEDLGADVAVVYSKEDVDKLLDMIEVFDK